MKHIFLIVSFLLPFAENGFADAPPNVLIILAGDMEANSKDVPWQNIPKEQLQQMRKGNDVTIR